MKTTRLVLAFLAWAIFTQIGWATPLYNNFGPSDSYYTNSAFLIGPLNGQDLWQGFLFTAAASGIITSIDVAVSYKPSSGPATMTFQLYADNGANPPNMLLDSYIVNTVASLDSGGSVETGLASGAVSLVAGTQYWLFATSTSTTYWMLNNTGDTSPRYYSTGGVGTPLQGPAGGTGAFRINSDAAPVPEPTSLALLSLGLAGLGFTRGRRKT